VHFPNHRHTNRPALPQPPNCLQQLYPSGSLPHSARTTTPLRSNPHKTTKPIALFFLLKKKRKKKEKKRQKKKRRKKREEKAPLHQVEPSRRGP
jgi:hypothetical protein